MMPEETKRRLGAVIELERRGRLNANQSKAFTAMIERGSDSNMLHENLSVATGALSRRIAALEEYDNKTGLQPAQKEYLAKLKERNDLGLSINPVTAFGEPALTMATGAIAEPVSGFVGLAGLPFGVDVAANAVRRTQDAMTYQPKTESGIRGLNAVGEAVEPLSKAIESGSLYMGDKTLEYTGSPLLASLAYSAPSIAPDLMGLKGASVAADAGKLGRQLEFGDIGGQSFRQRGSMSGLSDMKGDLIDVYHGGGFSGGDIESGFNQRGNLGSFYASTKQDIARNYARSGYFNSDEIGDNPGYLTKITTNKNDLLDLDSYSFDDLINDVGLDDIIEDFKSNNPDQWDELEMISESSGYDDINQWLATPEGIENIKQYVEDMSSDISYEAPSVSGTDVGVYLTANEDLIDKLLESKNKTGFIYEDADSGGVSVALSPRSKISAELIEQFKE